MWTRLLGNPFLAPILWKKKTQSTMDDARMAVNKGFPIGTVCASTTQSAGRGRIDGRRWEDDGENALLFTLVLKQGAPISKLPLTQILAWALCQYLEKTHLIISRIKWPNDVLIGAAKIAGILVEEENTFSLAGIGINVGQQSFSTKFENSATSIALILQEKAEKKLSYNPLKNISHTERGHILSPKNILIPLLTEIKSVLVRAPTSTMISQRLYGMGQPIKVFVGNPLRGETLEGIVCGIASDGALLLTLSNGKIQKIYSGEIRSKE